MSGRGTRLFFRTLRQNEWPPRPFTRHCSRKPEYNFKEINFFPQVSHESNETAD